MKFLSALLCLLVCLSTRLQADFHSQASQDKFVNTLLYDLSNKSDAGYYLEIGAGEPININNSNFFEKSRGWGGISVDISDTFSGPWSQLRNNPILIEDALTVDYRTVLQNYPAAIDYLSLDVDGFYDAVLQLLPHDEHIFKVITIEHDAYRYGDLYRTNEREILSALGYHLLCANVSLQGCAFEDWWIHPSSFSDEIYSELIVLDLDNQEHSQVLSKIRSHFNLDH